MTAELWSGIKLVLPSGHVEFVKPEQLSAAVSGIGQFLREHPEPRIDAIFRAVTKAFNIDDVTLRSHRRDEWISTPRFAAMALMAKHTEISLTGIARYFGLKSHGAAVNGIRRMEHELTKLKPEFVAQWRQAETLAEKYLKEIKE